MSEMVWRMMKLIEMTLAIGSAGVFVAVVLLLIHAGKSQGLALKQRLES